MSNDVANFVAEHILESDISTWQRLFIERAYALDFPSFIINDPDMPLMWFRADGDMECGCCGRQYVDHVHDADYPWLNVLCNGIGVKT